MKNNRCQYYVKNGKCTYMNDPDNPGECIYENGVFNPEASIHCSIGKEYMKENYEFKVYNKLREKLKDGRDNKIKLLTQEIQKLHNEIDRQSNRDLTEEIYNQYKLSEKNISLEEFRKKLYTENR